MGRQDLSTSTREQLHCPHHQGWACPPQVREGPWSSTVHHIQKAIDALQNMHIAWHNPTSIAHTGDKPPLNEDIVSTLHTLVKVSNVIHLLVNTHLVFLFFSLLALCRNCESDGQVTFTCGELWLSSPISTWYSDLLQWIQWVIDYTRVAITACTLQFLFFILVKRWGLS